MPTVDEIRQMLHSRRDSFYAELKKQQAEDEKYYEDTYDVGLREPFHTIRTGGGRLAVDTACDQINFTNPVCERRPRKNTTQEQELQDEVEQWLNGWLYRLSQDEPNPFRESIKTPGIFGELYGQVILNPDGDFPFTVQVYDPQVCFPSPGVTIGRMDDIIINYKRTIGDIKAGYPDWKPNELNRSDDSRVEWMEYHGPNQYYAEADGVAVTKKGKVMKTAVSFLPWVHCYAGYGRWSGAGTPETLAVGLLHGMRGVLKADAWIASLIDSITSLWTFPRVWTTAEPGELDLDLAPGKQIHIPGQHYDTTKVDHGIEPNPALFQYAAMLAARVNSFSPDTLRGMPAPSVESGYGQAVVGGYARLRYGTLLATAERFWSKILGMGLKIVDELDLTVPVYSVYDKDKQRYAKEIAISKGKIDGYYMCKVKLEASDPEARQRRMLTGADLWARGTIPFETMAEDFFGYPNATQLKAKIYAEKIVQNSPELQGLITQRVLDRLGMKDELQAIQAGQQEQQQMQQDFEEMPDRTRPPNLPPQPGSYQQLKQIMAASTKRRSLPPTGNLMGGMGGRPEVTG